MIKLVKSNEEYVRYSELIDETEIVPVYVNECHDICDYISEIESFYNFRYKKLEKYKILFLSTELNKFESIMSKLYSSCQIYYYDEHTNFSSEDNICIVGLYNNFQINIIQNIFNNNNFDYQKVKFLIARDYDSLSWLIAKQFFDTNITKNLVIVGNGLYRDEYQTIKKYESEDLKIITIFDLKNFSLFEKLDNTIYKTIIIYSHGKDDHICL